MISILLTAILTLFSRTDTYYCYQHTLNSYNGKLWITDQKCYISPVEITRMKKDIVRIQSDSLNLFIIRVTNYQNSAYKDRTSYWAMELGRPDHLYWVCEQQRRDGMIYSYIPVYLNRFEVILNQVQFNYSTIPFTPCK